ncbi:MAG TPA: hypothetical protein PL160_04555 [Candidatus Cloacimonas sp.]|nr:hypothetical protein [Candidatus Cloacimonas sp.]
MSHRKGLPASRWHKNQPEAGKTLPASRWQTRDRELQYCIVWVQQQIVP